MNASFSPKRPLIAGFITLTILLGGFGLWSVVTEISGAIIAPGRIEVEQNRQIVQHPDGGVVAEILVTEGDRVAAETVLIRLDPTRLTSERAIVEGQLFEPSVTACRPPPMTRSSLRPQPPIQKSNP